MKKNVIGHVIIVIIHCLLSISMLAQEKTQSYYNTHESELLPDAKTAFQNGKYERAVELCKWHYIIVGDKAADALRDMAERCTQLSEEMSDYYAAGKTKEARETAKKLLSLNSHDANAQQLLDELEMVDKPLPQDTKEDTGRAVEDAITREKPISKDPVITPPRDIEKSGEVGSKANTPVIRTGSRMSFVAKASVAALNLDRIREAIAPGGNFGLYDIDGSPVGFEVGGYYCPDLFSSGSLFDIDASLIVRIAKGIYPKIGAGYFSYTDNATDKSVKNGLCAVGGLTFLLGGHLCMEIGTKYYPEVSVQGFEMVSTTPGASYEFPSVKRILPGGIAPFVSFGWAF